LNNPTFRARTKASGLRLLRLPGGSWSNTYGWLSCELGADQPGAQPCDENWETWAAKPSDFIAFLKATEVEGLWVVDPNSMAKEAAALVAFFNGPSPTPGPSGLTTAGNFIIIYFSHETLGLGSSAGDQLYHCLAVVSGGEAPCPCPPIAYWDNPSRSASPRRHHGALRPSVLR
jgi:hypothetical protein